MHLFLDEERRGLDDQVGPVPLFLAAPNKLGIEVSVATLIGDPDRALLVVPQDRLKLGRWDVGTLVGLMLERFDRLFILAFFAMDLLMS